MHVNQKKIKKYTHACFDSIEGGGQLNLEYKGLAILGARQNEF